MLLTGGLRQLNYMSVAGAHGLICAGCLHVVRLLHKFFAVRGILKFSVAESEVKHKVVFMSFFPQ